MPINLQKKSIFICMMQNVKNYVHCIFISLLIFISQRSKGQINEIKSEADLPAATYSTLGFQPEESTAIVNWEKKISEQELKRCDNIIHNYNITDLNIQRQLFKTRVYCYFILENWDSTIAAIEQYKIISGEPPYWRKTNFVQVFAYAKSKQQTAIAFTDNYISLFYKTLATLKQNDEERVSESILTNLENSPGVLADKIEKSKQDSVVSGGAVLSLLETIVLNQIAKDIAPLLKRAAQKKESERYFIDALLRIPLRNGLKLSGILVLPKNFAKPLPAVLIVSCYASDEKLINEVIQTKKIAAEGFAGLMVFSRGKAGSEGNFYPGETEAQDNYDIIDWISRQTWGNGKVGMVGGSYAGQMQWQATLKMHPALKTIVPQAAEYNGIDVPFLNGVFQTANLSWLKYVTSGRFDNHDGRDEEKWNNIFLNYITKGIAFNRLDSLASNRTDSVFQKCLQHPAFDRYWQKMSPGKQEFAKIKIPILTMDGYFDDEQRGAIGYYNMHQKYGPKGTKNNHYLFIGPFDHNGSQGFTSNYIYPYKIDSAALIDQNEMVFQWFRHILKNGKMPSFLKDHVAVFVMGENKWHYFSSVQKMNRDTVTYFLNGKTGKQTGNLQLSYQKNGVDAKAIPLKFNTADITDDTLQVYTGENALVTEEVFKKKNILIFKTEQFAKPFILNGTISANLYLSLSVPDADIMLSWWEEDSDGKMWPLSQTVQRLSYSFSSSKRALWIKEKIYQVNLDNGYWMSKQLNKGSRLVMTLSPLADIQWEKNYGSGKDVSTETKQDGRPALLKIYINKKFPSNIKVPAM